MILEDLQKLHDLGQSPRVAVQFRSMTFGPPGIEREIQQHPICKVGPVILRGERI